MADKQYAAFAKVSLEHQARRMIDEAAQNGTNIYAVINTGDSSPARDWATVFTALLIGNPALASTSMRSLAATLARELAIEDFTLSRFSNPLSEKQKGYVAVMLEQAGYATSTLSNGTSIRNIIKKNMRLETDIVTVSTKFYADRVEIDGKAYNYRQRDRTATGDAWNDFAIRVSGCDVPLAVVLKLRGVGINAFRTADDNALSLASSLELQKRQSVCRPGQISPSLKQLKETVERVLTPRGPEEFKGTAISAMARLWWKELSPRRQAEVGFYEMAKMIEDDPLAREVMSRWVRGPDNLVANP